MENKGFGFEKPQEIHYGGEAPEVIKNAEQKIEVPAPKESFGNLEAELKDRINVIPDNQAAEISATPRTADLGADPEALRVMKIAETKGVDAAIGEIQKDSPDVIDEFHDKLMKEIQH